MENMRNAKGQFVKGGISWNKGKKIGPLSNETKKKISESEKGRKVSEVTKRKMSLSAMGKKGTNLGRKFSKEWKENIGKANKGKKRSEKERKRLSLLQKGNTGEKAGNWKGGISRERDYMKEKNKKWIGDNREYKNFLNLRRMARKKNAEGLHTFEEWQEIKKEFNYICPACGKDESEIKLTEDHIVPLSKNGTDYINNIQPLCKICNSIKHTQIIFYQPICQRNSQTTSMSAAK